MSWTMHQVMLRLLTPLHVGWRTVGNVQYTRPYATGKTLWGALTARLTRDYPELGGDYVVIGRRVNEELAFSYFYPAVDKDKGVDLWPWGETADEFAWRYLNTYASTALDYGRNAAQDGSLHETEYIAPKTRDGEQVYLVGYIFERAGCALDWRGALDRLQLGGERTYGWGRVTACVEQDDGSLFNLWRVENLNGERPLLGAAQETRLLAHTLAHGSGALDGVKGAIEPLVGRETRAAEAHGQSLPDARLCWSPGSMVAAGVRVCMTEYGLWQAA